MRNMRCLTVKLLTEAPWPYPITPGKYGATKMCSIFLISSTMQNCWTNDGVGLFGMVGSCSSRWLLIVLFLEYLLCLIFIFGANFFLVIDLSIFTFLTQPSVLDYLGLSHFRNFGMFVFFSTQLHSQITLIDLTRFLFSRILFFECLIFAILKCL